MAESRERVRGALNAIGPASTNRYTLTFRDGGLPPVNAFWSVTMYDGKTQLLIENPINRYLINAPMLPDLKKNGDGSITLYIQKNSPGADKEPNWLPAPDGPAYIHATLLAEGRLALDLQWHVEAARRATDPVRGKRFALSCLETSQQPPGGTPCDSRQPNLPGCLLVALSGY